ncbi:MAG TPA: LLM class flavin-dependent oxidoreductase, partial [Acidimicrobiaceae bacterium]|nr:LLM class flavin-dependent oxidoreductase [Acidimicrobiaceae bacterium]
MEFGIFNSVCMPPKFRAEHGAGAEHRRIMDEIRYVKAADAAGFKYAWVTEHHFLSEYSHLSANESFMGFAAAATENIHIGSGIINITPPVNP